MNGRRVVVVDGMGVDSVITLARRIPGIEVEAGEQVRRISFKGCVQALWQWESHLNQTKTSHQEQHRLIQLLYV